MMLTIALQRRYTLESCEMVGDQDLLFDAWTRVVWELLVRL
jgi:hypothetical protein